VTSGFDVSQDNAVSPRRDGRNISEVVVVASVVESGVKERRVERMAEFVSLNQNN
jgi:hypothetical protein